MSYDFLNFYKASVAFWWPREQLLQLECLLTHKKSALCRSSVCCLLKQEQDTKDFTIGCYFNFFITAILCFQIDGKTKKVKKIDTKCSSAHKSDGKIELMKPSIHPQSQPVADKSVGLSQTSVPLKLEIDNCSSEPNWLPCGNIIEPITKPPHLRSKVSL